MQVTYLLHIIQLTALAVSAAKLPTPPSTLYGAPLADLPTHSQSAFVPQTPAQSAQVPAELSTLYEAPAADVPTVLQSSPSIQNPGEGKLPSVNLQSPVHQSSSVQSPGIEIPVPAVPSTLYDLPTENLPKPVLQSSSVQSTVAGGSGPVPAQPSTQFDAPAGNRPEPAQSPITVLSPVNLVPVPAEPSTLYDVPSEGTQFSSQHSSVAQASAPAAPSGFQQAPVVPSGVLSSHDQQPNVVQTAAQIVPVPAEPSTLYDTPAQSFPLPSQSSSQIQTPTAGIQGQFIPADSSQTPVNAQSSFGSQVPTVVEIPQAPQIPSGLYEVPNEAQSTFSANPVNNFQGAPEPSGTFSHGSAIPSVPSGLYETPSENLPSTAILSSAHSAPQPGNIVPTKGSGAPILFPEQTNFQNQVPNLVPVPSVPSTLYEIPVKSSGKAMPSDNEFRNEYGAASSSVNTFSASTNSLITSNTKGGMIMGMPYDFQWGVDDQGSGNAFTHFERSDGKSTSGQYRVNLPDGRIQVVNFYDNGDGFHADVSYE